MKKHEQIIRDYAQAFSKGDLDAVCSLFAPDAVLYDIKDETLESARKAWSELISSFKVTLEIQALCVEDSVVVARYKERGVFESPFGGYMPTGRSYEISAIHWFEFKEDKIIRRWGARNTSSIARQIGLEQKEIET